MRLSAIPWSPALPNNVAVKGRDVGGTARDLIKVSSGDIATFGSGDLYTFLTGIGQVVPLHTMPFTVGYESSALTISLPSLTTLAHGLGGVPRLLYCALENVSGEWGWSPGQEIHWTPDAGVNRAINVAADGTNLYVAMNGLAMQIVDSGGTTRNITPANWKARVRAFR